MTSLTPKNDILRHLGLRTKNHTVMVDITADLNSLLVSEGVLSGLVHLHCPHTTAGLTLNEGTDPAVANDLLHCLDTLIPWDGPYTHAEGNSAAHIKASLLGAGLTLIIDQGKLVLGQWQSVFFCEFDGPRQRSVVIKLVSQD